MVVSSVLVLDSTKHTTMVISLEQIIFSQDLDGLSDICDHEALVSKYYKVSVTRLFYLHTLC